MLLTTIKKAYKTSIIKNFFIYSLSSILLRGISCITAPITMHILTPAQYGLLALANNFISVMTLFLGLGLRQAFSLEFFHCTRIEQKRMLNDIIIIYLLCTSVIFIGMFLRRADLNRVFFAGHAQLHIISICIAICFIYFFVELFYQMLQYQTKALQLATIQGSLALITITTQLLFLCVFQLGIASMLLAQLMSMGIGAIIGGYYYLQKQCLTHLQFTRGIRMIRLHISRGLPFIPSVLFGWILSSGDRWVLAQLSSMESVGIYALADAFGQLFHLCVLYPMSCSYIPYMLRQFSSTPDDAIALEQWNQKMMWYCMGGMLTLVTVGYFISKPLLFYLVPPAYQEAINYIWFILVGYIFLMGTYFANCFIQYHKKSFFLGFVLLIPATINIILNRVLIPHFSLYGCVGATLIAYVIHFYITIAYNYHLQSTHTKKPISAAQ